MTQFGACKSKYNCTRKGMWREEYGMFICTDCRTRMEKKAARDAIRQLQREYREGVRS